MAIADPTTLQIGEPLVVVADAAATGVGSSQRFIFQAPPGQPTSLMLVAYLTGVFTALSLEVEVSLESPTNYIPLARWYPLLGKKKRVELWPGVLYRVRVASFAGGTSVKVIAVATVGPVSQPYAPGTGTLRHFIGTDPAANVDWFEVVPASTIWRLLSVYAQLITSAQAANRRVPFYVSNGDIYFSIEAAADQIASQTRDYSWGSGAGVVVGPGAAPGQTFAGTFPVDTYLFPGYSVGVITLNRQTSDNWGAPSLMLEEWFDG